jgi:hypothetical protein
MYQLPSPNQNDPTVPSVPPSYPQTPPLYAPPPPPKPKRRIWLWVILIIFAVIAYGTYQDSLKSANAPATSTTSTGSTPAPTDTPTPTPAPLTARSAIDSRVKDDIAAATLVGDIIQAGYGKKNNAFALVGLNPPLTMSQGDQLVLVQNDCFDGERAIWTDPLLQNIGSMEVFIFTQDSQGLPVTVGDCLLHPKTAAKIDWNTTDATTAWNKKVYESMAP